jgi:hypothetical protein
MSVALDGWARRALGRLKGYGGCYRCGATWDYAQPHTTYFSDNEGCFPLCESCWSLLTPGDRMPYYADLMNAWTEQVPGRPDWALESLKKWPAIEKAVLDGL